jgi:hypothetical protein
MPHGFLYITREQCIHYLIWQRAKAALLRGGDISNGNSRLQPSTENEAVGIRNVLKPRCCGGYKHWQQRALARCVFIYGYLSTGWSCGFEGGIFGFSA